MNKKKSGRRCNILREEVETHTQRRERQIERGRRASNQHIEPPLAHPQVKKNEEAEID